MISRPLVFHLLSLSIISALLFASTGNTEDSTGRSSRNHLQETRVLLRAAHTDFNDGKFGDALVLLDSILIIDAKQADAYYLKAKIILHQGDSAAAAGILEEATQSAPRSTRIKLLLTRVYLNQGLWEKPLVLTDEVLAIKPGNGEAEYLKGWGLLISGDTQKALDLFESALTTALDGGRR